MLVPRIIQSESSSSFRFSSENCYCSLTCDSDVNYDGQVMLSIWNQFVSFYCVASVLSAWKGIQRKNFQPGCKKTTPACRGTVKTTTTLIILMDYDERDFWDSCCVANRENLLWHKRMSEKRWKRTETCDSHMIVSFLIWSSLNDSTWNSICSFFRRSLKFSIAAM